MSEKPKCSQCNERDVFSKGLCSGCYGRNWRAARKTERDAAIAEQPPPKRLTSGVTNDEMAVIEGEVVHDEPTGPLNLHLIALGPAQMEAARSDVKIWLEHKLDAIAREIVEANRALNEARRNGWATTSLTVARNRAVDDETYYHKILMAVEAGHTIIPEFPVEIFAVRRHEPDKSQTQTFRHVVNGRDTYLGHPVQSDCAPAGAGEYRNPQAAARSEVRENRAPDAQEKGQPRYWTTVRRTGHPVGPIQFPAMTARAPIMQKTAEVMKDKVFDQIGVCLPVANAAAASARRVQTRAARAGDPLVIGQILRKKQGNMQRCVSFIIAWYLNLEDL